MMALRLGDAIAKLKAAQAAEQASTGQSSIATVTKQVRISPEGVVEFKEKPHKEAKAKLRRDISAIRPEKGSSPKSGLKRDGSTLGLVSELVKEGKLRKEANLVPSKSLPELSPRSSTRNLTSCTRRRSSSRVSTSRCTSRRQSAPCRPPSASSARRRRAFPPTGSLPPPPSIAAQLAVATALSPSKSAPGFQAVGAAPNSSSYSLASATMLRGSHKNQLPALTPSNRSEAIRLHELLDSLLQAERGGWAHLCESTIRRSASSFCRWARTAPSAASSSRIRKFYQIAIKSERESRQATSTARDELRILGPFQQGSTELDKDLTLAREKIDGFRAEMLRMKMLKAVHEKQLNEAELRRKDLERDLADAQTQIIELAEQLDMEKGRGGDVG